MGESYHFRARWEFDAPKEAVYEGLYEVIHYPRWWPQFTKVKRIDEDDFEMTVRSFFGYDLDYQLKTTKHDLEQGILQAKVEGDIHGSITWSIQSNKDGRCIVRFAQDVSTTEWYMNLLAPIVRWAFVWAHNRVMDRGRVGLRAFLAGYELAKTDPQALKSL